MKSIFKSKTFWVAVLSAAADIGGVLPPSEHVVSILAAVHVILRFLTEEPVRVL